MKILEEILKIEKIKSYEDYVNFANGGYHTKFLELLDSFEHTDGNIVLENKIINNPDLYFSNFKNLSINNCIFNGKVRIFINNFNSNGKIEIDNSIFLKELLINGKNSKYSFEIYHSNFSYISFSEFYSNELIIHNSKLLLLNIEDANINYFDTENNQIEYMEIKNYFIDRINFDFDQIGKNFIKGRFNKKIREFSLKENSRLEYKLNLFEFIKFYQKKELKEKVNYSSLNSLIKFVKEKTNIEKNRNNLNNILFWETFLSQKTLGGKLFVLFSGAFFYPERFIYFGVLIFLLFTFLYTIPIMHFSTGGVIRNLNFSEALYFSGVTFTTLGYGDVYPVGISRFASLLESFSGIIIMNTFLVSLLKKYID